jgi:hypothetical protein
LVVSGVLLTFKEIEYVDLLDAGFVEAVQRWGDVGARGQETDVVDGVVFFDL